MTVTVPTLVLVLPLVALMVFGWGILAVRAERWLSRWLVARWKARHGWTVEDDERYLWAVRKAGLDE